jgi:glucose-1-phosphate thymidylyltransferase
LLTIVACGGSGSRLAPATKFVNKHLVPVGNGELMVDLPLKFLAKHGIEDIHVVTGSSHASQICEYIADGERYGFENVEYSFQSKPLGIADVFKRVSNKYWDSSVLLILGDNYFSHAQEMVRSLHLGLGFPLMAYAWEFDIKDKLRATSFGQIFRDSNAVPESIIEKPSNPQHSRILTGLYYFPPGVFKMVEELSPSKRGELEITDLLRMYLDQNRLRVQTVVGQWADLGELDTWMDFIAARSLSHQREQQNRIGNYEH